MTSIEWIADGDGEYVLTVLGTRVIIRRDTAHGWAFTLIDGGRTTYNGFPTRDAAHGAAERLVHSLSLA